MIVVDATVAIAWAMHEADHVERLAALLASDHLIVPPLWRLEVLNVVLKRERQRLITSEQAVRLLKDLDSVGVEVVDLLPERSLEQMANLARPHQLSSYDAVYLDLAIAMSASLLTLDRNLIDAANRLSVSLVAP